MLKFEYFGLFNIKVILLKRNWTNLTKRKRKTSTVCYINVMFIMAHSHQKIFYIGWALDCHQTEWVPIQYYAAFTHIRCRKDGDLI